VKELVQWINWRYEHRGDKVTKVPICPHTGELAAVDRLETWGTYQEAVQAVRDCGYAGVGFVFSEGDPYTGVDLDKCRNPETGEMESWARELGHRLAVLETSIHFNTAKSLYQNSGYETIENYHPYVGLEESVCMKKRL